MTPLVLFATALLVRAAVGAMFPGPAYPDSYYYVNLAQQLAAGNGFTIDYIWNFVEVGGQIPPEPALPIPANAHWMPLAALVQVPFIWLLGPTSLAAGLPFWIVGAAAAPLTYFIGRDAGFTHLAATGAGLLAAAPGGLTPFLSQPDNFGLYMTLGALSLWLCGRGLAGDRRAFIVGGAVVGLAALARSDGILLGLPFALVGLHRLWRDHRRTAWLAAGAACVGLFALVFGPWALRQLAVFGSVFPSVGSGRILWITDYAQLYSVGPPLSPADLLAQGAGPLLFSRVGGFLSALGLFALLPLVVVLTPLAFVGAWAWRSHPHFRPFFTYAVALFAASGLLFAVHVPFGTFIHSAAALVPHTYLLVVAGVGIVVAWIARRRSTWEVPRATAVFTYGAVAIVVAGAIVQTSITTRGWSQVRAVEQQVASGLSGAQPMDRVMSADAGAYRYLTGYGGVVTPNNPLAVIESAMRAYDVRWLALESQSIVPALEPVLDGSVRPDWLSMPVASVQRTNVPIADGATAATVAGADTATVAALYAVCFAPTDNRCLP